MPLLPRNCKSYERRSNATVGSADGKARSVGSFV